MLSSLKNYLGGIQLEAFQRSHIFALERIIKLITSESILLELGADKMQMYSQIASQVAVPRENFVGVDYNSENIAEAIERGYIAHRVDLSFEKLPHEVSHIDVAFSLQTIEHLLNPHFFLKNVYQALKPGGHFIVTTPNQAAWFNILHLILGLPPSSGPHMDCESVRRKLALFVRVWSDDQDVEEEENRFRHLHVHTYRGLKALLSHVGFINISSQSFGYHPFPPLISRMLCRIDPYHAHHMLFQCQKPEE